MTGITRKGAASVLGAVVGAAFVLAYAAEDILPGAPPASEQEAPSEPPAPAASSSAVIHEKAIALAAAFPDLAAAEGRTFRARKIVIAPGARTEDEIGDDQPSIAYVAKGAAIERRSDAEGPIRRTLHEASGLTRGVTRSWENDGTEAAEILIVDIVPPQR